MSHSEEIKPEKTEDAVVRMDAERATLEEAQKLMKLDEGSTEELRRLQNAQHDTELDTRRPFSDPIEFQRYLAHKKGSESYWHPDPQGVLSQGEIISFDGVNYIFMGVDDEHDGDALLRRVVLDTEGNTTDYLEEHVPIGALYQAIEGTQNEVQEGEPTETHEPATHEPPATIDAVSEVMPSVSPAEQGSLSPGAQEEKERAERLNALKADIDEAWTALNANEKRDTNESKKNYTDAQRRLNRLRLEAEGVALELVGSSFFEPIKLADPVSLALYKGKVGKVSKEERKEKEEASGLSKEEIDARYEALRRKDAFIDQLAAKGVNKDIAAYLYHEALHHAKELVWLNDELKRGETSILSGARARNILEWHGVTAREPKTVAEALTPIIADYETLPPKAERPKREVAKAVQKAERKRPVERIFESIAAGQEIDDKVLRSFLKDEKTIPEERMKLEAELARRAERRKGEKAASEKTAKPLSRGEHIDEVIDEGKGDTIPVEILRKFIRRPKVAAYLQEHTIPEVTADASVSERSGRVTEDMIENAPQAEEYPTTESRFEIKQSLKQNREGGKAEARTVAAGAAISPQEPTPDGIPVLTDVVETIPLSVDEGIPTLTDVYEPSPGGEVAPAGEVAPKNELPPLNHGVVRQFEQKFGMSEEALQNIEDFRKLSNGRQLLVLKNLEQIALVDIKKEARAEQKEEWGKTPALKRIWKQVYSFGMNPEHRVAELEKELLVKHRGGADNDPARAKILAEHLANIEQLAKVAAEGPAVNIASDGTLEMVYLEEGIHKLTPEQKKVVEEFNSAATEFAKFPREWGYETTEPGIFEHWGSERRRYEAAKARYALARANTLQLRRDKFAEEIAADPARKGEDPEKRAMLGTNLWDERVELTQLFNNHPDAEVALQQIEDQNTISAAAKEFWKSKGMFIAGGAAVRMATIAISGGIMFPVIGLIGGGVGAGIGRAGGKKLIRTRREDGRMSEEDLREEIVVTNKNTGEAIMGVDGKPLKRQIKEFTDATFFIDRMDRLTEKLWNTEDLNEKRLIKKKLAQTNLLMSERFERGMINFGGSSLEREDERKGNTIANRLSFMQSMAKGQISHTVDYEALEAEIERITGLHQSTIEAKRKKEILKRAAQSAAIRGFFALTGAGIVQGVKEIVHFGEPGFFGTTSVKAPGGIQEVSPSGTSSSGAVGTEHVSGAPSYADAAPDSANPEAFNAANFDKNIPEVLGRAPSPEELSALRSTGFGSNGAPANMDQHNALIEAISKSKVPLTHGEIEAILGKGGDGTVATLAYEVKSGDNLTRIMKEHLGVMKDLTPGQQENVIQNFIHSFSPEEMKEIGITDPNNIRIGQNIQLDKLNEILLHKEVGGESIITHAQHAFSGSPVVPEHIAPSGSTASPDALGKFIQEYEARGGTASERASLWYSLSDANKQSYIHEAVPRHIGEDMSKLFVKGPFEEWPKEWLSLRGRTATEVLLQTGETDPRAFLPGATIPPGYEWPVVSKIQQYVMEHGLTPEKGFVPREKETLEEFLNRALGERILREGPLPWLKL